MSDEHEDLRSRLNDAHNAIGHLQEIITELIWQARENGYMDADDAECWYREVHAAIFRDPVLLEEGGDAIHDAENIVRAAQERGDEPDAG